MNIKTPFAALFVILSFQACQSGTENAPLTSEEPAVEAAPAPVANTGSLQLTEDGLNGINDQTAFSIDAIEKALPAFTIAEGTQPTEAGEQRTITGSIDGTEQVFFTPDAAGQKVKSIHIMRGNFTGPEGQQAGRTYAQTQGNVYDCYPGVKELSGLAVCSNGANLRYIYRHGWNGPDNELPPRKTLTSAPLVQMVWERGREKSDPALTQAMNAFLKKKGVRPDTSRYQIAWADLNFDLKTDAVVMMEGGDWCGPGGCTMLVFEAADGNFRLVTEIGFVSKPVLLTPFVSKGWRSFIVQLVDKGAMPLQYDGQTYPDSPVNEAPMASDNFPGRVIFQ